jgi:hypothetical protein
MPRRLCSLLAAGVLAAALAAVLATVLARLPALAQTPPPATPPADNTTVVPRVLKLGGQGQITVSLSLTDGSQPIVQGLVWRVFRDKAAAGASAGGKGLLVSTHKEASPTLRLDPGIYWINVALGRASLTRKITIVADRIDKAHFVLNAGGLRIVPVLANGESANLKLVAFDVESEERDEHGQRSKVVIGAKAGVVLRLNAGLYSIVSTYGDANATARADVWVEAGRLSEVKVVHPAAEVSFKLVTRGGGDAIADTQWSVTRQGEVVKETSGALPTHFLAPGTYTVSARHAGRFHRRDFTVKAGETRLVEVVMP